MQRNVTCKLYFAMNIECNVNQIYRMEETYISLAYKSKIFIHTYSTTFSLKVHNQTLYVECKDLTNHVI